MPKSKGISSPLLFSFCTLSRYLCHSFQHCQLVYHTILYSFFHIDSLSFCISVKHFDFVHILLYIEKICNNWYWHKASF